MFGDKMKAARLALGYSAEQVAAYLGCSPATVYRYEKGDISKMPAETLRLLADYLCVPQGYLMGWESMPDNLPPSESIAVPDPLSDEEHLLISSWRSADDSIKAAVRKLLDM